MEVQENVSLAPYTTLKIGGSARFFIRLTSTADIPLALAFARKNHLPVFILGGGSNLVVPDEGFAGVVLAIAFESSIVRTDVTDAVLYDVSAGTDWDALVRQVCAEGVSGMECLAGIPGLTGGAPIQNIGAYGQEVADIVDSVTAVDLPTLTTREFSRAECGFSYRHSIFNSTQAGRHLVTAVRFRLSKNARPNLSYADLQPLRAGTPTPLEVYDFVRQTRDRKGMLIDPAHPHADSRSAGSFFKNPVVPAARLSAIAATLRLAEDQIPHWPMRDHAPEASDPSGPVPSQASGDAQIKLAAAWLIERAGFSKGFTLGGAAISSRHTLALTNQSGSSTCADLLALRDQIVSGVEDKFNVQLQQEPVFLRVSPEPFRPAPA